MFSDISSQMFDPAYYEMRWEEIFANPTTGVPGSAESKFIWDKKAPSFAKKGFRGDYISQLIQLMKLYDGESVFDMGCGSGTLAIPLILDGHEVIAVDFSDAMLEELKAAAEKENLDSNLLHIYCRSWQDEWDDMPNADIAVASRSFFTKDLAGGIAKLESKARKRVALTLKAGDLPYRDSGVIITLGRETGTTTLHELFLLVSYLFSIGRLPNISYIEYPGRTYRDTKEALRDDLIGIYKPTAKELPAMEAFLDERIVFDGQKGMYCLDYCRMNRWAFVMWDVPTGDSK